MFLNSILESISTTKNRLLNNFFSQGCLHRRQPPDAKGIIPHLTNIFRTRKENVVQVSNKPTLVLALFSGAFVLKRRGPFCS